MGDISTVVIGLLLLVPITIAAGVACCAIKCSEWQFLTRYKTIRKQHKRNKSDNGSQPQDHTSSEDSVDVEKGPTS